jgi:hypothetical protein
VHQGGLTGGVLSSRWRRKKTTSSFPSQNGIPGWAGSWAELPGRLGGLRPGKPLFFSASYSFSIFCFAVLNSNLIFNSVLQDLEHG